MDSTAVKAVTDEAVFTIAFKGMYFMVDVKVGVFVDGTPLPPASLTKGFRHTVRLAPGIHEILVRSGLRRAKYCVELSPGNACEMWLSYSRTWGNFDKEYALDSVNWEEAVNRKPPVLNDACPEQDLNVLRREEWKLRWKTFSRIFACTGFPFGLIAGLVHGSGAYGVVNGLLFGFYMGCFFAVIGVSRTSKWYRKRK
jgi:hypothetical protein